MISLKLYFLIFKLILSVISLFEEELNRFYCKWLLFSGISPKVKLLLDLS
jgi:hypothetical protein